MIKIIRLLLITVFSSTVVLGEVIVYDRFSDAPSTNIPSGWIEVLEGKTIDQVRHGYVASNSLNYAGTVSTNNSFGLGNKTANYLKTFSAQTLAEDETIYFSALVRFNDGFVKNFNTGAFRLYDSNDPYGNAVMVGVGTSNYLANTMGFSISSRNYNWLNTSSVRTPDVYVMSNAVHLLVGSYTRGTNGNGSGVVNLWVDPAISASPDTPTLSIASYNEDEDYDTFEIISGGSGSFPADWQFDELKVGTEWIDVVSDSVPADQPPFAMFSANPVSGTKPLTVVFSDASSGTITNRYWDFGDGTTTNTSMVSVVHTYTNSGSYSVELVVSGPLGGSTNTQNDLIAVTDPVVPDASFSADPVSGYSPLLVSFVDNSTGTITNRYWDFGDGTATNTSQTAISHAFATAGVYTVALTASGPAGMDTDTQADLIAVTDLPSGTVVVAADTADTYIRYDAEVRFSGDSEMRVGQYSTADVAQYQVGIYPFLLPDLGGETISEASLKIEVIGEAYFSSSSGQKLDIIGVRTNALPTVVGTDQSGGTIVGQEVLDMIDDPGVLGIKTFTETGLATYLQSIYDNDPNAAGNYVFLRLAPHAPDARANSYLRIASADSTVAQVPTLTLMLDSGGGTSTNPPPASAVSISTFGSGQDVINWTTVQGSGFVYNIWYSTNLIDGFQPLETNLSDMVQSYTNLINASPVFYKITAE